jgi:nucleoside-diphosphate-sugar epimerase
VESLTAAGTRVRVLLRPYSKPRWLQSSPLVDVQRVDYSEASTLARALESVRTIYHLAAVTSAPRPEDYFRGNLDVTRSLLSAAEAAAPDAAFVYCSSLAAAGPAREGRPLVETDSPRPISPYGQSKLDAEHAVQSSRMHGVIIRPPAVYGPRDVDILEMFRWISRGIAPVVGRRDQNLSMLHVHDLVNGLIAASAAPAGALYFLTDGRVHRRSTIIEMLKQVAQRRTLDVAIPVSLAMSLAHLSRAVARISGAKPLLTPERIRDLLESDWTSDDSLARRELGYRQEVSLEQGLSGTARWYKDNKWI